MSFCFWMKSSGYYNGCWLTKACWVLRKWLPSSHWKPWRWYGWRFHPTNLRSGWTTYQLEDCTHQQQDWKRFNKPNEMKYQPIQLPCGEANLQNWSSAITQVNCDDLKWMQLIFGDAWWMVFVGKQPSNSHQTALEIMGFSFCEVRLPTSLQRLTSRCFRDFRDMLSMAEEVWLGF